MMPYCNTVPRMFVCIGLICLGHCLGESCAAQEPKDDKRVYTNSLRRIADPSPLLADHPEYFEPIIEETHFEAPAIVNDSDADLHVRAWRFSYNARGIIEMPNYLRASDTAVIMVHPWGIDDGQGWESPEPAGVADFCTKRKNHLAGRHTREIIQPFIESMRPHVALVMYSLRGSRDPVRAKMYRSITHTPTLQQRKEGGAELERVLGRFSYRGQPLPVELSLSTDKPVRDYFRQFPGLDASARYNNSGFWDLPVPVTSDLKIAPDDVVFYDEDGYEKLKAFLEQQGVRHVLLTGYATDMCFCRTTAGYENLSRDFNVFLVGDATLATFPANKTPQFAVNAAISFASLSQLITQVSWIRLEGDKK